MCKIFNWSCYKFIGFEGENALKTVEKLNSVLRCVPAGRGQTYWHKQIFSPVNNNLIDFTDIKATTLSHIFAGT